MGRNSAAQQVHVSVHVSKCVSECVSECASERERENVCVQFIPCSDVDGSLPVFRRFTESSANVRSSRQIDASRHTHTHTRTHAHTHTRTHRARHGWFWLTKVFDALNQAVHLLLPDDCCCHSCSVKLQLQCLYNKQSNAYTRERVSRCVSARALFQLQASGCGCFVAIGGNRSRIRTCKRS